MDEMKLQQRWQYYISSYIRVEPTEGVPRSKLTRTVLARNLPSVDDDEGAIPKPVSFDENLVVSICLKSAQMVWGPGSSEGFRYEHVPETKEDAKLARDHVRGTAVSRRSKLARKFVMNNAWMKDLSQDEVDKLKGEYKKLSEGEPEPEPEPVPVPEPEVVGAQGAESEKPDVSPPTPPAAVEDVEMAGT
jgi:paired amphipathic helix protein Sin3a